MVTCRYYCGCRQTNDKPPARCPHCTSPAITAQSVPHDYPMGHWCPNNLPERKAA